jgi:hypothetical protein
VQDHEDDTENDDADRHDTGYHRPVLPTDTTADEE